MNTCRYYQLNRASDGTTHSVTNLESMSTSPPLSPSSSASSSPSPPPSPHHLLSAEAHEPPAKQPCLSKEADIGVFVAEKSSGANMTDHDKHQLVVHHFIPDPTYEFPRSEKTGRRFNHSWLSNYAWLRYSKSCDGGFCLPCVLFAKRAGFRSAPDLFVRKPLGDIDSHFVKALELLRKHDNRGYHKRAIVTLEEFMKVMSNKQPTIQHQLNQQAMRQIQSNRAKVCSIIETIILCGRQNISLRGHRDTSIDLERDPCASHGNFWALLEFRIAAGDTVLKDHLANAPANAKYTHQIK